MKITRNKKKALAVKKLTPEEHLRKQLALRYFVDKNLTIKEVAEKLRTKPVKIKEFFQDPDFLEELDRRIEIVHGVGKDFMVDQSKISLVYLYEEMRRREVEGELKDVPTREIHKMIVDTQKELRLDTPGAYTSKVGVGDLGNLQDRYEKSLSGKFHKRKLKNITPRKKAIGAGEISSEDNKDRAGGVG